MDPSGRAAPDGEHQQVQSDLGSAYIELPLPIEQRKACVNVEIRGDDCFKWAVLSALSPAAKNPHRITHYRPYEDRINTQGVVFPLMPRDVPKFEKLNPDISVNVYVLEKRENIFCAAILRVQVQKSTSHQSFASTKLLY